MIFVEALFGLALVVYNSLMQQHYLGYILCVSERSGFSPNADRCGAYIFGIGNITLITENVGFDGGNKENDHCAGNEETAPGFAENLEGFLHKHFGGKVTDEASEKHAYAYHYAGSGGAGLKEHLEENGEQQQTEHKRAAEAEAIFENGLEYVYRNYIGGGLHSPLAENKHCAYGKDNANDCVDDECPPVI